MRAGTKRFKEFSVPSFKQIAVALDFGRQDEKLIAFALGQGKPDSRYILLHVVESVSAKLHGNSTGDLESRQDEIRLQLYADELRKRGCAVVTRLGYRHRVAEIIRIVREDQADLLIMGAHGHTGLKDLVYGETINRVRHEIKLPVLVVNV